MSTKKKLTFVLMDPPFESARSTTALRLIGIAVNKGIDVNVFAYEGAVSLAFAGQKPHSNPVHGRSVEEEDHPTTKDWIAAIYEQAKISGSKIDWVQCGFCVDERGAGEYAPEMRRNGPTELLKFIENSDNVLVIPTR
ncbi:DsrE/DsrF/TusD sulfur relay family protein [Silvanigrella aquatica]|uniref:FeS-binding protein n=1 Tax=Silvanigrella aquatica TaxID=1915309 RepID=A0A1L4D117_9BACT|nr:DsrE family protein [Silvanigrella aquatica]APJ03884.1 FeS-binding protein [Silvanigrella aquatica]